MPSFFEWGKREGKILSFKYNQAQGHDLNIYTVPFRTRAKAQPQV